MTDTQALVISLAKSLPEPTRGYILYLDNLFPNIPLAKALGEIDIGIMGTIRIKALGFPLELVQLKQAKQSLKWGHLETAEVDGISCFLWQDNNRVLDMIIIYNSFL